MVTEIVVFPGLTRDLWLWGEFEVPDQDWDDRLVWLEVPDQVRDDRLIWFEVPAPPIESGAGSGREDSVGWVTWAPARRNPCGCSPVRQISLGGLSIEHDEV